MNLIKEIINSSLLEKLKILEKYYNLKIILSSVMVTRNYHILKIYWKKNIVIFPFRWLFI